MIYGEIQQEEPVTPETAIFPEPTPTPTTVSINGSQYTVYLPYVNYFAEKTSTPQPTTRLHYVYTLEGGYVPDPADYPRANIASETYDYQADPEKCKDPLYLATVRRIFDPNNPPAEICIDGKTIIAGNEIFRPDQDNITVEQFADNLAVLEDWGVQDAIIVNDIIFFESNKDKVRQGLKLFRERHGGRNPNYKIRIGVHIYREPFEEQNLQELQTWVSDQIREWQQLARQEGLSEEIVVTEFGVVSDIKNDSRTVQTVEAMLNGMRDAGVEDAFLFSWYYPYGDFSNLVNENGSLTDLGKYFVKETYKRNPEIVNLLQTRQNINNGTPGSEANLISQSEIGLVMLLMVILNKFRQKHGKTIDVATLNN